MDDAHRAAAQALSAFDPLAALKRVALRDDPQALALRGVAMAQLGDFAAARKLLTRAARGLEDIDPRGFARCLAAHAEVVLAARDLDVAGAALDAAVEALRAQGDVRNVLFLQLQQVRLQVLLGAVDDAEEALGRVDVRRAPAHLQAMAALSRMDIAIRRLDAREARAALALAAAAARAAAVGSLTAEVERAARELDAPMARLASAGAARLVKLDDVERVLRSSDVVIDACRRTVREGEVQVSLVARPVLLALAASLAGRAPEEATRHALAEAAFGVRRMNDSVRARLRVEIGRLRRALIDVADVVATTNGYALRPRRAVGVVALLPPAEGTASAVLALLRSGASWSTSSLALALDSGQRTVQRALLALRDEGRVESIGRGRTQRWVARASEPFATSLLLTLAPTGGSSSRG